MPSAIVTVCAVLPSYITVVPPMRIVSAFGFGSAAGAMFCVISSILTGTSQTSLVVFA